MPTVEAEVREIESRYADGFGDIEQAAEDVATLLVLLAAADEVLQQCAALGCIRSFWGARSSCLEAGDGRENCATCQARAIVGGSGADS